MFEVDDLKVWMGEPYVINDKISVFQPSLRDIINASEREYFSTVQTICSTSSNMKSQLDSMGLDWEKIEDFQMFMMLSQTLTVDKTHLVLGDLDLSKFKPHENTQNGDIVLVDVENNIIIDKLIYMQITEYLRKAHGFTRLHDVASTRFAHQMAIEMDREELEKNKNKPYKSFLFPLVSSLKARQKYTKQYILDMQIFEFMNEINRCQIIVQTDALLQGSYSGMVDMKKIPKSSFDWLRDIGEKQSGQQFSAGTF